MSQEKVDRYKEQKRNRDKILKKEKRQARILKIGGIVVALVLVGWIGFSTYLRATDRSNATGKTYSVDTASLDEYLNNMSVEEAETEAETE